MRDARGRSADPKPLGDVLKGFRAEVAPETPLAAVQSVWDEVVGTKIAAVTDVVEEREGLVTVACSSAVWTQELELMAPRISARLEERLGVTEPLKLRFRTSG